MTETNRLADQRFNPTREAYPLRRGKIWVTTVDANPEFGIKQDVLVFAGVDRLTLSVEETRAFRDWLTSILPEVT